MRILLTGADGQVGQALQKVLAPHHALQLTSRTTLDIADYQAVDQIVAAQPDMVIHPAAWTNVDGCALDPTRAYVVNGLGTKHVALACQRLDIPLVYISTNEVFDGTAATPYYEWDIPNPINPYARSKWLGEQFVQQLLRRFYLVRVAWVFGGQHNFVRTVLRLAQDRPTFTMVADEWGNPTFAGDIAVAIEQLVRQPAYGIYHFVNEGHCSRWEFAQEIMRQAGHTGSEIVPITLAEYQRASTPPPFTALHNFVGAHSLGIRLRPWQAALSDYLVELAGPQP